MLHLLLCYGGHVFNCLLQWLTNLFLYMNLSSKVNINQTFIDPNNRIIFNMIESLAEYYMQKFKPLGSAQ
jgi:hypothetical protein